MVWHGVVLGLIVAVFISGWMYFTLNVAAKAFSETHEDEL